MFQSLFSWNLPSKQGRGVWLWLLLEVSILVFLELALEVLFVSYIIPHLSVSILVFLELALEDLITLRGISPINMFQSLFSWNLPSKYKTYKERGWIDCFNPCFLGTCPRSSQHLPILLHSSVSILVFLELALEVNFCLVAAVHSTVSILVFLELALEEKFRRRTTIIIFVSILVFLELALEAIPPLSYSRTSGCFNPCFLGTCPRSRSPKFDSFPPHQVSILVFLELALEDDDLEPWMEIYMFQSLFSWNLPSKAAYRKLSGYSSSCFNPCFLGTCPRRWHSVRCRRSVGVSILVFLELALEASFRSLAAAWLSCFNPCFLGTCPRRLSNAALGEVIICFNPCFLGTCPRR